MTALTITRLPDKSRGECVRCHGTAAYVVKQDGKRPERVCVWCARKYRVAA